MPDFGEKEFIQNYIKSQASGSSSGYGILQPQNRVYMGSSMKRVPGKSTPLQMKGGFDVSGPASTIAANLREQAKSISGPRRKADKWATPDQAASDIYSWSDDKMAQFRNRLTLAGYKGDQMSRADLIASWGDLVKVSAGYGAKGQKIGPWELLSSRAGGGSGGGATASATGPGNNYAQNPQTGELAYIGPSQVTSQSRDVNYTDPDTARSIVNRTMQGFLGRDPTKSEIRDFTDALHQAEANNPLVTEKTEFFNDKGESTKVESVSSGGLSPNVSTQMAEDEAKSSSEYGSVQAATTYMDALRSLVYGS